MIKKVTKHNFCREISKFFDAIWRDQEEDLRMKDSRNTDRKHEFHINVCLKGEENTKNLYIYKQSNNKKEDKPAHLYNILLICLNRK